MPSAHSSVLRRERKPAVLVGHNVMAIIQPSACWMGYGVTLSGFRFRFYL